MASDLQHNSLEESKTLRKEAEELRSLQQALRDTNSQLLDIEKKRNEEKELLLDAESSLESMKPIKDFLEQRDFLSESDTHRPLLWLYGTFNTPESSPTTAGSLINSSHQLVKLVKQDREEYEAWRSAGFYKCARDLVSEIMENVQNSNRVRKVMEKDESYGEEKEQLHVRCS